MSRDIKHLLVEFKNYKKKILLLLCFSIKISTFFFYKHCIITNNSIISSVFIPILQLFEMNCGYTQEPLRKNGIAYLRTFLTDYLLVSY